MSEIKWQVVDVPETDHPFDENNAVLDEYGTPTWCLDCEIVTWWRRDGM